MSIEHLDFVMWNVNPKILGIVDNNLIANYKY